MRTGEWGEMVSASERAKAEERSKQKAQSLKWASLSVSLAADGKRWKEYQLCGEQERVSTASAIRCCCNIPTHCNTQPLISRIRRLANLWRIVCAPTRMVLVRLAVQWTVLYNAR